MSRIDVTVRATNAFYAQNGAAYWTLGELGDALVTLPEETFAHHVNAERNDFASWITGCFEGSEQAFADSLRGQSREGMIKAFIDAKRVIETPVHAPIVHETSAHPVQTPPTTHLHVHATPVHEERLLHDEKRPVANAWPSTSSEPTVSVSRILEDLSAARLMAKVDITAAREKFIATRTTVFSKLADEERVHVLPKLRETYEYLRHAR